MAKQKRELQRELEAQKTRLEKYREELDRHHARITAIVGAFLVGDCSKLTCF
jgi:uncharacterized membrane-anchored protein YhcB (DUF1043 family)